MKGFMRHPPAPGALVLILYAQKPAWEAVTPLHGRFGKVVHAALPGKPRNILVEIIPTVEDVVRYGYGLEWRKVIVPLGNLRRCKIL
jgi:hypothetical protein